MDNHNLQHDVSCYASAHLSSLRMFLVRNSKLLSMTSVAVGTSPSSTLSLSARGTDDACIR